MTFDKLNSLQFLFLKRNYFEEIGGRDAVYVESLPFELRNHLLRRTLATSERDHYFFIHEGRVAITREGWEEFIRWVCLAMDRQITLD